MNWTEKQVQIVMNDLAEEDAFACRALMKVTRVIFTEKVNTLAVSLEKKPDLFINKHFIDQHAISETDIKTLMLHEFLHILLLHNENYDLNTPLLNLSLDAVINAIIHREYGERYSDLFTRFYRWGTIESMLRPAPGYKNDYDNDIVHIDLYKGRISADDMYELLNLLRPKVGGGTSNIIYIGNHGEKGKVNNENRALIDDIIERLDGTGIWNKDRGIGDIKKGITDEMDIGVFRRRRWKQSVHQLLKKCLTPDPRSMHKNSYAEGLITLPVLSGSDRRAMLTVMHSPILPFATHTIMSTEDRGTAAIYLDVSGSMKEELHEIAKLLYHFRGYIRKPLWVFSDSVQQAHFLNLRLELKTSYGTSIACVFDHIRANRIKKAVIVTDGYVEEITAEMLSGIDRSNLQVLISENGTSSPFYNNNIPYFQLPKYDL